MMHADAMEGPDDKDKIFVDIVQADELYKDSSQAGSAAHTIAKP